MLVSLGQYGSGGDYGLYQREPRWAYTKTHTVWFQGTERREMREYWVGYHQGRGYVHFN